MQAMNLITSVPPPYILSGLKMEFASLLKVLLALACCGLGQSQVTAPEPQIGDLRLINGSSPDTSGLVQVYFKSSEGKDPDWGYICGANSRTTADTICRQLGFVGAESSKTEPITNAKYWLTSLSCPSINQHILRCPWVRDDQASCTSALYVACDPFRIWQSGLEEAQAYNGEVQLCSRFANASSHGRLVVFRKQGSSQAWGTVNNQNSILFSRDDADSACRQLGYTGSVPGSIQKATPIECTGVAKKWTQASASSCRKGVSYPCFGCCFPVNPTTDTCTGCEAKNDIIIQCNPPSAGDSKSCTSNSGSKPGGDACAGTSSSSGNYGAAVAFLVIFLLISIGLGIALAVVCYLFIYKKQQKGYDNL